MTDSEIYVASKLPKYYQRAIYIVNQIKNNSLAESHQPKHGQCPDDILKSRMNLSAIKGTTLHHMTHLVVTVHVSDTLIRAVEHVRKLALVAQGTHIQQFRGYREVEHEVTVEESKHCN